MGAAGAVLQIPALQQREESRACPRCSAFLGWKTPAPCGVVLPNGLGGVKNTDGGLF